MNFKTRMFFILLAAGMVGVLSLLLIDLPELIAILPSAATAELPMSISALKLISLVQPAVLVALASLIGVALAPRVGLFAHVAQAAATGESVGSALKPQILPGIVGAFVSVITIVLIAALTKAFLPAEIVARISEFGRIMPLATRLLYGGITEEILLRWGFMTLVVWIAWRLVTKGRDQPTTTIFVTAIVISTVVFAIGHLPIAFMLIPNPTLALTLFVIFGNSAFGLIAGFLYWKKGLESAMIAHALGHVFLFTASYFGAYF